MKDYAGSIRLRTFTSFKENEVPDHLLQEVWNMEKELIKAMQPILDKSHPNIILSAMNKILALMIKRFVAENAEEQTDAVLIMASNLIKNVEYFCNIKIFEKKE